MKGYINIQLGGQKRGLKFGVRSVFDFCDLRGQTPSNLSISMDYTTVCQIVYVGLASNAFRKGEDLNADMKDVELWVDDLSFTDMRTIFDAFVSTLVGDEKKSANEEGATQSATQSGK